MMYFGNLNDALTSADLTVESEQKKLEQVKKCIEILSLVSDGKHGDQKTPTFNEAEVILKKYSSIMLQYFFTNPPAIKVVKAAALAMIKLSASDEEAAKAFSAVAHYLDLEVRLENYKNKVDMISDY